MDARFQNLGFPSNASKNLGSSIQIGVAGVRVGGGHSADTTLSLDSPGFSINFLTASKGIKRKCSLIDGFIAQKVGSALHLGLGNSSSSLNSKGSLETECTTISSAEETDEKSLMRLDLDVPLHLSNEETPNPKKSGKFEVPSKVDLELSLSTGPAESDTTTFCPTSTSSPNVIQMSPTIGGSSQVDEGSTSSHWRRGRSSYSLQTSLNPEADLSMNHPVREIKPTPITPDLYLSVITTPKSSVTCTSGIIQQHSSSSKTCQFKGCGKGARGASGLCIAHGGGRRCQRLGCHKGAEGRTAYCKAHGGGRRCEFLGCTKSAEGPTDYCIAHGGGRRCSHQGCTRAARGKSRLCIRHGGGKRCQEKDCTKSAEGLSGLCISHGGGRRCQYPSCTKGAQGSTMFCKAHGGGKRCTFEGCTKGVHGGTLFCVAHGGGKRCAAPDCTKSARGRTDFCVRHGGGKRCKVEGCGKSAQGSTDFCKAHGGGKRCNWGGQLGSEFHKGHGPCNSFARGKNGLCTYHGGLMQDKWVHGCGTVAPIVESEPSEVKNTKGIGINDEMSVNFMKLACSVVNSAGYTVSGCAPFGLQQASPPDGGSLSVVPVMVPEGRVHGGSLMAMLTGHSDLSVSLGKV